MRKFLPLARLASRISEEALSYTMRFRIAAGRNNNEVGMYIAMNRFRIVPGQENAFEQVWEERDTRLTEVPGFMAFHLLKGPKADDHTLYSSHTIWTNEAAFEAWTRSEAFRQAHQGAGDRKHIYMGHPVFEGFEVVQQI